MDNLVDCCFSSTSSLVSPSSSLSFHVSTFYKSFLYYVLIILKDGETLHFSPFQSNPLRSSVLRTNRSKSLTFSSRSGKLRVTETL